MKTVLTKFLAISGVALLMLASCKKDEVKVVATNGTPGALQASSTTIVLTKADIANTAVTFTLTNANFGFKAAETNVLQIDVKGDNFATPKEFTIGSGSKTQAFSVPDFNAILLALNLPTGVASQVEARFKSQISATTPAVFSNTVDLTVTPFALISYLWVPGTYQNTDASSGKQWQPATADSLVSPTGNGVYTGYVHFVAAGEFKVTDTKNWNTAKAYGDAGGGTISSSGGNLKAPGTGLYMVTVDLNANTIAYKINDHLWSIIGDGAKGWDPGDDVDMTFNQNNNVYQVTTALSSTGAIKFRADHDWGLNYGGTAPLAPLVVNGGNLPVPSSATYQVNLTFGDPLLGPTYTLVKQ